MVPALTKSMDLSRIEKGENVRRKKECMEKTCWKKFKNICCMILGKHTGQIYEKICRRFLQSKSGFRRIYRNTADHASCFLIFFSEKFHWLEFFLNLLVLPTVGIVLGSGVTGLLAGCVSFSVGRVVILPGKVLAGIYEELCKLSGNLPFGIWITGQPKLWQVAVYYILFAGAVWILTQKGKRREK